MKVTYTFEPTFVRLSFPMLESFLTLKFDGKIEIPYSAITRIVVQPPEAFHVLKGLKVGYGGIKDAAATYYHFDGTGPEFHLYSRPEKSVGFILQKSSNSKTVVYDKVIVEVQEDPLEFANLVCATVLEKIGFQVIIATPKTEKVPLAETDARAF